MIDKLLDGLNNEQREAVLFNDGPLAIIAAAGSGKTRVIVHKIAYLITALKIPPWRILAVTFTNKAAAEMRERVIKMVDVRAESVNVLTYHALCARILRQEIKHFDYPSDFTILDQIDQKQVLSEIYKKLNVSQRDLPPQQVLSYISRAKMHGISFAGAQEQASSDGEKKLANFYKQYGLALNQAKALDFDDLLIFVDRLFRAKPDVAARWAAKFDYVLVDEFQDTAHIQYQIIKNLIRDGKLTIVGDPDQTIYSWRRADASLIRNFQQHFANSRVILLEKNYRSTQTILDRANALIKHNTRRIDKELKATISAGEAVEFFQGFSDDDEARWVASRISLMHRQGAPLRSFAILYRANYLSATLEKAFITANLRYIVWGGTGFYQRQEIKDAIAYLKIISNSDEVSLKRMINIPSRKLGAIALEEIDKIQTAHSISYWTAITEFLSEINLGAAQRAALLAFTTQILQARKLLSERKISDVLAWFLDEVGYNATLNPQTEQARIENLKELVLMISNWEGENASGKLDEYLQETSLFLDRDEALDAKDYITLMTVHTAKGLEFDHVFIFGFSEGVFPSQRSIDDHEGGGLEEERRLAYVAITRAKKRLFVSTSRGFSIDRNFQKQPSRFIKEMGLSTYQNQSELWGERSRAATPRDDNSRFWDENPQRPLSTKSASVRDNYVVERNLIAGDQVVHQTFGQGVVVHVNGELVDVAFRSPVGVKTVLKNHKMLQKIGE